MCMIWLGVVWRFGICMHGMVGIYRFALGGCMGGQALKFETLSSEYIPALDIWYCRFLYRCVSAVVCKSML